MVGTTSGARSYHDVLAAQQKYGEVTIQPVLPSEQQAQKGFSIKQYGQAYLSNIQNALTQGKEATPVNYLVDVGKGIGSFFFQSGKQLAATVPVIASELFNTIKTGKTSYSIKATSPISGLAASFLEPSLGFSPQEQSQYEANVKTINTSIAAIKNQAKSLGITLPSITPPAGSAGGAVGSIAGLILGLYGTKELVPLRYEKYSLPVGKTQEIVTKTITGAHAKEQVPVFSTVYKGITLGYGQGKPLIGSYSGKIATGLKPELLKYPEAAASGTRFEVGTGSGFETKVFQNPKTQTYLKEQGLLPERTEKGITLATSIAKESVKTPEVQFQKGYSFTQEPFLKLQGKEQLGALKFLAEKQ
ncbi:MAG: hypothetical protein KGI08_11335, partial [Thaumarchaeota archaeon]|nr:hypothetical protein [Nitrososphaerota archaeon]